MTLSFTFMAFAGPADVPGISGLENSTFEAILIDDDAAMSGGYSWAVAKVVTFQADGREAIQRRHRIMRSRPFASKTRAIIDFKLVMARFREDTRSLHGFDGIQFIDSTFKLRMSLLQWQTLVNKTERYWFGQEDRIGPTWAKSINPSQIQDFEEV